MPTVHGTFRHNNTSINQYKYSDRLYQRELQVHEASLAEYKHEVVRDLLETSAKTQPNFKLYENQPYITSIVRNKLIDFLLRLAVRLKIVSYVFCKAVRLFDRYCSKRIVLLDQAQLVITTCLWIAAKFHGGNNHFANLTCSNGASVKTILNLGFGSGSRFNGPTERYRMPKTSELIKLCGTRCNYDTAMFKQMELHILTTLDWKVSDASVDEYLASSIDLKSCTDEDLQQRVDVSLVKAFVTYSACYSYDLVRFAPIEIAKAAVDLLNTVFHSHYPEPELFRLNDPEFEDIPELQSGERSKYLQDLLTQAVINSPAYLLKCFDSYAPNYLFSTLTRCYRPTYNTERLTPPRKFSSTARASIVGMSQGNYTYSPTKLSTSASSQDSFVFHTMESEVPYVERTKNRSFKSPISESARSSSHHYPMVKSPIPAGKTPGALAIPPSSYYLQPKPIFSDNFYHHNDSQSSFASTNSSKGSADIFFESKDHGAYTPNSMEEDIKPMKKQERAT